MPQTSYSRELSVGIEGALADNSMHETWTGINVTGSPIPPGRFVCRASTTAGTEQRCKLPAAATDVTAGAARGVSLYQSIHTNPLINTNVDPSFYQDGEPFPVVRRGVMWVKPETSVTAGNKVFVRFATSVNTPALTARGRFRNDADTNTGADTAAELLGARWESTGAADTLQRISFDIRPTS